MELIGQRTYSISLTLARIKCICYWFHILPPSVSLFKHSVGWDQNFNVHIVNWNWRFVQYKTLPPEAIDQCEYGHNPNNVYFLQVIGEQEGIYRCKNSLGTHTYPEYGKDYSDNRKALGRHIDELLGYNKAKIIVYQCTNMVDVCITGIANKYPLQLFDEPFMIAMTTVMSKQQTSQVQCYNVHMSMWQLFLPNNVYL